MAGAESGTVGYTLLQSPPRVTSWEPSSLPRVTRSGQAAVWTGTGKGSRWEEEAQFGRGYPA